MEDIKEVIKEELSKGNTFDSLANLRPYGSRLNLDSFKGFSDQQRYEFKKGLLIRKKELLEKSIAEQNEKLELGEEAGIKKSEDEADLKKGIVGDLQYGSTSDGKGLTFTKTGKELKTQLPAIIANLTAKVEAIKTKMAAAVKAADCEPDTETSYYSESSVYPRYSYELYRTENGVAPTDAQKAMQLYNDLVYVLCDVERDIQIGSVMARNLDDKKKYILNVRQLAGLGF